MTVLEKESWIMFDITFEDLSAYGIALTIDGNNVNINYVQTTGVPILAVGSSIAPLLARLLEAASKAQFEKNKTNFTPLASYPLPQRGLPVVDPTNNAYYVTVSHHFLYRLPLGQANTIIPVFN